MNKISKTILAVLIISAPAQGMLNSAWNTTKQFVKKHPHATAAGLYLLAFTQKNRLCASALGLCGLALVVYGYMPEEPDIDSHPHNIVNKVSTWSNVHACLQTLYPEEASENNDVLRGSPCLLYSDLIQKGFENCFDRKLRYKNLKSILTQSLADSSTKTQFLDMVEKRFKQECAQDLYKANLFARKKIHGLHDMKFSFE